MSKASPTGSAFPVRATWIRWGVYTCFFFSGATSLVFEVLWSRQFVTVFGNSSYAISIVVCAYMTGLGLGGWLGGRISDRTVRHVPLFAATQTAIALWALAIPLELARLRFWVPGISALAPESLAISTLVRFALSFGILAGPCILMGATLPILARAVADSDQSIGTRIGALYGWNTLGAALGSFAAGFWMLDTCGLRLTNFTAIAMNLVVALAAFGLTRINTAPRTAPPGLAASSPTPARSNADPANASRPSEDDDSGVAWLLLTVAFFNGLAGLACEVLWFRHIAFLEQAPYVFPTILCIYLLGVGVGGWLYSFLAGRIHFSTRSLGMLEMLLALSVPGAFAVGALAYAAGPPHAFEMKGMAWLTVFAPAVFMGGSFPLLCGVYGCHVRGLGRRVGAIFAANTAGTVLGSILPIFVLVPLFGIERSLLLASLTFAAMGVLLLVRGRPASWRLGALTITAYAAAIAVFAACAPSNLCRRVFLAKNFNLAGHTDILFYRESRTGTAILARDRADGCKTLYVNGNAEVPLLYADECCFKMLGDLGPMLQNDSKDVLMICFGGGIAAGAATCVQEVQSLTIVDLENSVVEAAALLGVENHQVLQNPKTRVVIDDGRNYLLTSRRRWPVIISDSTHPKTSDSWVLYTREFYELVRRRLTGDGVFVEWVPRHGLSTPEFKIIARTFQSVFPHTSLWVTHGMEEQGQYISYALFVGTPEPLKIDVARLQKRLAEAAVQQDLEPFGLNTAAGFLDAFVCAEDALRQWAGDGPINTDDLPYTQYQTRYSRKNLMETVEFLGPMESAWPYLAVNGASESAKRLQDELAIREKANRLAFLGRFEAAYGLLPDDIRYRRMRSLLEAGPHYAKSLLKQYWDNPAGLLYLIKLGSGGPGGLAGMKPVFERVRELDPGNVPALNFFAAADTEAGRFAEAEACLRRALARDPDHAPSHYNLALLLDRMGRHAEAVEHCRKAADRNAKAAELLATWLAADGKAAEAIAWFSRAVELQPDMAQARVHLALLLERAGRPEDALDQMRFVAKMDPENPWSMQILAKLQSQAGVDCRRDR